MITEIMHAVIKDLGATGVLLVGLWFISQKMADKIITKLCYLNDELNDIRTTLKEIKEQINRSIHGQN